MASIITEYPRPNHMRPPQGQTTAEGLNPGDPGYVDPHGETMQEFNEIQGALNEEGGTESLWELVNSNKMILMVLII